MKKLVIGIITVTVLLMAGLIFIETKGNDKNEDFNYKVVETDSGIIVIDVDNSGVDEDGYHYIRGVYFPNEE